jgi:hypothetical protein
MSTEDSPKQKKLIRRIKTITTINDTQSIIVEQDTNPEEVNKDLTPKKKRLIRRVKTVNDSIDEIQSTNSNKGTGAGGANTNLYGKKFEDKTNNELRLLEQGYTKKYYKNKPSTRQCDYYLSKEFHDKTVIFVLQNGLKSYMKNIYNIESFRNPDEAYIFEYKSGKKVIKILEKKEQRVEGSVETKLLAGPGCKREYELVIGDNFEVHYAFCVSDFLKTKLTSDHLKYIKLNIIFKEYNIGILFGDDDNYFETFDKWLNQ